MPAVELVIGPEDAGARLDVVLVRRVEGMSRARARTLTEEGKVRVNGRRARKGHALAAGDRVEIEELPPPGDFPAAPDPDLPLSIVHEDADLVAIDKAAGVPSHPLTPDETGTVAGALVARYPEMAGIGYRRREPGIVHRLDNDTSGLMLAARSARAFTALRDALKAGRIDKSYLALCAGRVGAPRTIDLPIANHPRDARRVVACLTESEVARLKPRPAETEVLSARPICGMSLVEVRVRGARRHQIRAHLAAIGHPLAGDVLYEGPAVEGLGRHFLHASGIELLHPVSGARLWLRSALPVELQTVLDRLGG